MDEVNSKAAGGLAEPATSPSPPDPGDPFECPNCGQLLAPTCRVCVACHYPVDDAARAAPPAPQPVATPLPPEPIPSLKSRTQFSWRIFLVVLGVYVCIVFLSEKYLSAANYEALLTGVLVGTSLWVLYDAHSKRVPHPFRWGVSSLLLWIVVFPWYLSRRRAPESPCPLMEAQTSVFLRALLGIIVIFLFLSIVAALLTHKLPHH
ncbi:MAG: hypothetical protein ACRD2G_07250 [Terriglobia bacterium]